MSENLWVKAPRDSLDFNEEAQKIFERFGKRKDGGAAAGAGGGFARNSPYNDMDAIWKHPSTGGVIYCGNQTAAASLALLNSKTITFVVNCTHGSAAIANYHKSSLQYYTFPIAAWEMYAGSTDSSLQQFVDPLFKFIDTALEKGESVLVHCLAGAHRAGTTSVACLIHYGGIMNVREAIACAQELRSAINPIGHLPDFLVRLLRMEASKRA